MNPLTHTHESLGCQAKLGDPLAGCCGCSDCPALASLSAFEDFIRKRYNHHTGRVRIYAVRAVAGRLGYEDMCELARHLRREQSLKGTKVSRARRALDDYMAFLSDPMAWQPIRGRGRRAKRVH